MASHVDILIAEIGSTTTVVNAFTGLATSDPQFVGQGVAPTSVMDGDVTIGLQQAIDDLKCNLDVTDLTWDEMLATSSAAGGLRMTVHGLVYDMTVRAAKEAALGAGAIIRMVTAGELTETDLEEIRRESPNIVLLAGGVDYGEKRTIIDNARKLAPLLPNIPVIFAGNVAARAEVERIFTAAGVRAYYVENVYPRIDELNIEPTRAAIQDVFEEHIINAPGMEKIKTMVSGVVMPTPGAVMQAAKLAKQYLGDVMVLDVGGATTDVHSVTPGSEKVNTMLISPEPEAKRTVEGDLGVFVNFRNVVELIGIEELEQAVGPNLPEIMETWSPIPQTDAARQMLAVLTQKAVEVAVERHVGQFRHLYGPSGRITVAEGKDLSNVKYIIGTGGPLTRLPEGRDILAGLRRGGRSSLLLPTQDAKVLIDTDYIMAVAGVLSKRYPEAAMRLLLKSFGLDAEVLETREKP